MTLENQVASLELSRKLKELGVRQESLFYWANTERVKPTLYVRTGIGDTTFGYTTLGAEEVRGNPYWFPEEELDEDDWYSAFTVAELADVLADEKYLTLTKVNTGRWTSTYYNNDGLAEPGKDSFIEQKLPDAMAQMLIYLLENKLVKVADLKQ